MFGSTGSCCIQSVLIASEIIRMACVRFRMISAPGPRLVRVLLITDYYYSVIIDFKVYIVYCCPCTLAIQDVNLNK